MKRLMFYSKRKLPDMAKSRDIIRENGVMIFLCTMFLCGLVTGISVYFGAERERELITLFVQRYISRSAVQLFLYEIVLNSAALFFAALSGISAVGLPFVSAVPFVRGVLNGITAAYLVADFSAVGYGRYAVMNVPGECLCVLSMLYLCDMCASDSVRVFKLLFTERGERPNGARYIAVCGICAVVGVLSCAVNLLMRLIFGGIFVLD